MSDLEFIADYLNRNRQVGHTWAMLNGALAQKDCWIICANERHAKQIKRVLPRASTAKPISIFQARNLLKESNKPLVIDNFALEMLVSDHSDQTLKQVMKERIKR